MTITESYKQAKADYEFLKRHHGGQDCNDLTGGYVADEAYFELLANPTKKNAYLHYCALISHYAGAGYEAGNDVGGARPDFENKNVRDIFIRNCDEHTILLSWGVDISEEE